MFEMLSASLAQIHIFFLTQEFFSIFVYGIVYPFLQLKQFFLLLFSIFHYLLQEMNGTRALSKILASK